MIGPSGKNFSRLCLLHTNASLVKPSQMDMSESVWENLREQGDYFHGGFPYPTNDLLDGNLKRLDAGVCIFNKLPKVSPQCIFLTSFISLLPSAFKTHLMLKILVNSLISKAIGILIMRERVQLIWRENNNINNHNNSTEKALRRHQWPPCHH